MGKNCFLLNDVVVLCVWIILMRLICVYVFYTKSFFNIFFLNKMNRLLEEVYGVHL